MPDERRDVLTQQATDYVLEHGLIGLSLRPMAASLGTSDRMLLYHFGRKDDLVAAVLEASNTRSVAALRALDPAADVRRAVLQLWATVSSPALLGCQRVYVEASALGLFGREPYASVVGAANEAWLAAVRDYLAASGAPRRSAARAAILVEAAFSGFLLDQPFEEGSARQRRAVADLAVAAQSLAAS